LEKWRKQSLVGLTPGLKKIWNKFAQNAGLKTAKTSASSMIDFQKTNLRFQNNKKSAVIQLYVITNEWSQRDLIKSLSLKNFGSILIFFPLFSSFFVSELFFSDTWRHTYERWEIHKKDIFCKTFFKQFCYITEVLNTSWL
jgi:hypothetical protein